MARLPNPGGDDNQWGNILNAYLEVALNDDGSLRPVAKSSLDGGVQASLGRADSAVQIGGDLSGSNTSPTVSGLNGVTISGSAANGKGLIATGTNAASWGTLPSAAVSSVNTKTGAVNLTAGDVSAVAIGALVLDVKDYGAVGNGSTDDGAALVATINAAAAAPNGALIYLPAGNYRTTQQFNITTPNISVVGAGTSLTTITGAGSNEVFKFTTGANFGTVRNLTIVTGASNPTGLSIVATDCIAQFVTVTCNAASATGITVKAGGARSQVLNCNVSGGTTQCIAVADDDVVVESCSVTGSGDGTISGQAGIQITAGQRARIRFNTCNNNHTHGIRYASTGADGPEIAFNTCNGNGDLAAAQLPTAVAGRGITITSGSGNVGCRLIGNRCNSNYENGVIVTNGTTDIVVEGNVCKNNNVGNFAGGHGIEIDCAGTIVGNICSGNNRGISTTNDQLIIANNLCYSNTNGMYKDGIAVNGAANTITGNVCYANGNDGILLYSFNGNAAVHCQLNGNVCYSNTNFGIEITSTNNNCTVGPNTCYSNTAGDFSWSSSTVAALGIRGTADDNQGVVYTTTYGATIALDGYLAQDYAITATDGNAFTISNPVHKYSGRSITIDVLNSSGGALGTITWDTAFKLAGAFTNPATGKRRTISFYWNSGASSWIERSRSPNDI